MDNISRNLVFGVQDGVVTTIGLMTGVSLTETKKADIVRFVLISVLVSSFSMSIGSYQSERASQNFSGNLDRSKMAQGAVVMFLAYFFAGVLVMSPYGFTNTNRSLITSAVIISSVLLGIVGGYTAMTAGIQSVTSQTIETVSLGLLAVLLGYVSGKISVNVH